MNFKLRDNRIILKDINVIGCEELFKSYTLFIDGKINKVVFNKLTKFLKPLTFEKFLSEPYEENKYDILITENESEAMREHKYFLAVEIRAKYDLRLETSWVKTEFLNEKLPYSLHLIVKNPKRITDSFIGDKLPKELKNIISDYF